MHLELSTSLIEKQKKIFCGIKISYLGELNKIYLGISFHYREKNICIYLNLSMQTLIHMYLYESVQTRLNKMLYILSPAGTCSRAARFGVFLSSIFMRSSHTDRRKHNAHPMSMYWTVRIHIRTTKRNEGMRKQRTRIL